MQLVSPLVRLRFHGNLAEEWSALAAGANNLPSPGGPVLRIAGASVSASQMRQAPQVPPSMLLSGANTTNEGEEGTGRGQGGQEPGIERQGPAVVLRKRCD